ELAVAPWPRRGEALIRHPAEQLSLGRHGLVHLELKTLVAAVELETPAAVGEVLRAAGVLNDAVQRDELRHHDLSHASDARTVSARRACDRCVAQRRRGLVRAASISSRRRCTSASN